jgi:hypothetical protein
MSKSVDELQADVVEARNALADTVGELGGAIDDTKAELRDRAKRALPIAVAAVGALIVLKVVFGRR